MKPRCDELPLSAIVPSSGTTAKDGLPGIMPLRGMTAGGRNRLGVHSSAQPGGFQPENAAGRHLNERSENNTPQIAHVGEKESEKMAPLKPCISQKCCKHFTLNNFLQLLPILVSNSG
jgi:hypothetical protein